MSFHEFVLSRRAGNNPRGDFIRDTRDYARCHPNWQMAEYEPNSINMPAGACREAIAEGRKLWCEYSSSDAR